MHLWSYLVPSKKEQCQEARFEKEGKDPLGSQRASKDIPHKAGVGGPVGTKLKFHHDARGNPDGKDESEYFRPEMGQMMKKGVSHLDVDPLHDDQQNT